MAVMLSQMVLSGRGEGTKFNSIDGTIHHCNIYRVNWLNIAGCESSRTLSNEITSPRYVMECGAYSKDFTILDIYILI